jgi:hypothetical protein
MGPSGSQSEAKLRIKAGLLKAQAEVVASSREDGTKVREVCLQKSFDVFADEYFIAGLLTESVMAELIPLYVYDAAVSGNWQTGAPERNSGCTLQFGRHWVPRNTPERLRTLFEAQVLRWRAKLLEANVGGAKRLVGCEPAIHRRLGRTPDQSIQRWEDLEIRFLSDERVQIYVCGRASDTKNFAEMRFEDRRGKGGKPNAAWSLLRELARSEGMFPATAISGQQDMQKRAQEIRKVLCAQFGLSEDPIPFREGTGYVAAFKITKSPACDT